MSCPSCGAAGVSGARFCASCGAAAPDPSSDATVPSGAGDETRLSGPTPTRRPKSISSGSGWLSSTPGIDHGRFAPGTLVADRYRIIGLLGRGGMGEVFRADDLRLGQQVALKFLPEALERDPSRLAQFHNEVRTARQVSHNNVCRVYDIGEIDGQHFLTMEYIDGEDLSSLLRRIGRLPEDKAIEIARQICAGLHAAHERGVLHRDLKPANIMLDREGRVRITDFSLAAAIGTAEDIRAGTPAYMAPEQLAGREVTTRSDIYALGLVLYELFTGKRALDAKTVSDLMDQHASGAITMPTEVVTSLDPVTERAIMRCLQTEPAKRPPTAIAVAASLPGGDPLAAALAAGETPSPEMVAAAGSASAALSPLAGVIWIALIVGMLTIVAVLGDRFQLLSRVKPELSTEVLLDRARGIERSLGLGEPVDREWGFAQAADYLAWLERTATDAHPFARLRDPQPPALFFWYRSSPRYLVAGAGRGYVGFSDPPVTVTGMVNMVLGADGRLYEFHLVPTQVESLSPSASSAIDWQRFFDAAGLDRARFTETTPDWTPRSYADARQAWTGSFAGLPGVPVRVDVASHRGWPVYFQISGPWARPTRMAVAPPNKSARIFGIIQALLFPAFIVGAALLARRNMKRGKGDRRGATRVSVVVFGLSMTAWLFKAHHLPDMGIAIDQFFAAAAAGLFEAGLVWIFYLAVEPQVRKVWPHILITWSRLVGGSVRDPLVGRDLLAGTAAGLLLTILTLVYQYVPLLMGRPEFQPVSSNLDPLLGPAALISTLAEQGAVAIQNGMLGVLGLALFRMILKNTRAAFVAGVLVFAPMAARGQFESGMPAVDFTFGALLCMVLLLLVLRYGLFATVIGFFAHFSTYRIVLTLEPSRIYFQSALIVVVVLVAIAATGFYFARAGEPLFGKLLAEE